MQLMKPPYEPKVAHCGSARWVEWPGAGSGGSKNVVTRGQRHVSSTYIGHRWVSASCQRAKSLLAILADAVTKASISGVRPHLAELHRLNGEALAQSGALHEEAVASFQRAVEVAQEQGAKSLELRAATSMARLWRDQGKVQQARELLAPVYDWFTEGFDTLDLKEAKALLDELHA
jgi:predicted ATPase